jgi:LuxR family maltose regulon positive regulatory protein
MALHVDVQLLTEDYVWHEVLANGDPEVIDVLLKVSVLDRVNTALATAITGRSDVRSLLLRGEAQGLFVYRLGGDGWFRIHPFVREALLNELTRSSGHLRCHARAAQFLEDSGETVSALEQWLLAGQPRQALRLLGARSTELYDGGREAVLMRTVEAIPVDVASVDVESLIDFAVGHILGSRAKFADAVRQAVWLADRTEHDFAAQLDALRAISSTMSGDWTTGGAAAVRSLRDTTTSWWTDPAVRFSWNTATRALALGERWDDDDPLVIDATIAMSRDPRRGMSLEGVRALGHALSGRPVDALRIAAGVRHAAPTMTILRVELGLAEAIARRELGDRERALAELRELADDTDEPRLYVPVSARLELALAASEDGDSDRAAGELAQAEALVNDDHGGADLREWLHSVSSSIASDAGRIEDAVRSAELIGDPFWGPVARSQVRIVLGDLPTASEQLAAAEPRCVRHRVVLGLLSARLASHPDDVLNHVTVAVGEASAHGMLQTVVAYGRELMDVIERAAWAVPEEWLQRLRLAMTSSEIRLDLPAREFVEPLTDRERDVLRLLPSRLTLTEIAKELYVSVNTLKFHLRVIYRKLGVNSREEAAAIARSRVKVPSPSGSR